MIQGVDLAGSLFWISMLNKPFNVFAVSHFKISNLMKGNACLTLY